MEIRQARLLLGFPPNSRPTPSQVKAAFRERVWDFHPDRVPDHAKAHAESKFKLFPLEDFMDEYMDEYDVRSLQLAFVWWRRFIISCLFTSCENWSSSSNRRKKLGLDGCSILLHNFWSSRTWRTKRHEGLQEAEGGIPFFSQSISPLIRVTRIGILVHWLVMGHDAWIRQSLPNCGNQCRKYQQSSFLLC
ncbi:hypothetical protein AKJ16_DCAP26187 [Drosera capensis]